MHHDGVLGGIRLLVPHPAVDLLGGEDAPQVAHEQIHDLQLRGRQLHRLPVHQQHPLLRLVAQPAVDDLPALALGVHVPQLGVPPQLAAHPGHQLLGVEGLGHIVVRPHGQAQHLVGVLALGGQDDDGQVALLPDLHHRRQPVQLGHHHVDEDQAQGRVQGAVQGLHAVVGLENPVALLLQQNGDGLDDLLVVIHHQNTLVHTNPSYGRYLTSSFCQRA